jgi:hypothetical protein
LVKTILELLNLNICSAMNSSTDVLGQFYEVFLKYGNGAKEIGIVLTPSAHNPVRGGCCWDRPYRHRARPGMWHRRFSRGGL